MKKSLVILGLLACLQGLSSTTCTAEVSVNNLLQSNATCIDPLPCSDAKYILYPTRNTYTFLRLDSSTGAVELYQWSFEDSQSLHYEAFPSCLLSSEVPQIGRFQLLPTTNIYVFMRLDRITGYVDFIEWKTCYTGYMTKTYKDFIS